MKLVLLYFWSERAKIKGDIVSASRSFGEPHEFTGSIFETAYQSRLNKSLVYTFSFTSSRQASYLLAMIT